MNLVKDQVLELNDKFDFLIATMLAQGKLQNNNEEHKLLRDKENDHEGEMTFAKWHNEAITADLCNRSAMRSNGPTFKKMLGRMMDNKANMKSTIRSESFATKTSV